MKRTQVMGGLLAAFAIALCSIAGPGDLLAGKGGGGGRPAPPPISYSMVYLGSLSGSASYPHRVNNNGIVIGNTTNADGFRVAFISDPDLPPGQQMIDFNDRLQAEGLTAFDPQTLTGSLAYAAWDINDNNQVVGGLLRADGVVIDRVGFLYTPASGSSPSELVLLQPTAVTGIAIPLSINAAGQVAGYIAAQYDDGFGHAFVWTNGQFLILDDIVGPDNRATDINDIGQVCGGATYSDVAWRYTLSTGIYEDLGTVFTKSNITVNWAVAINNSGQVAGNSIDGSKPFGPKKGFLYTDGQILTLQLSNDWSYATSLNTHGDVIGSAVTKTGDWHPFVYLDGTGIVDLYDTIINLDPNGAGDVSGINDNLEICGAVNGQAYVLIPQ